MDTVSVVSACVSAMGAAISAVTLWLLPTLERRRELYFDFFRIQNPYRNPDYLLRIRHEYGARVVALLWHLETASEVETQYRKSGFSQLLLDKSQARGFARDSQEILRDHYIKCDALRDLYTNAFWKNFWGKYLKDPHTNEDTKPGEECKR